MVAKPADKLALPAANLPPPPLNTIEGADVYPVPPLVIVTPVTSAFSWTEPTAPVPGSPTAEVNTNVGVDVYPEPGFVTMSLCTESVPSRAATTVAPDPPPPVTVTVGGTKYPKPP